MSFVKTKENLHYTAARNSVVFMFPFQNYFTAAVEKNAFPQKSCVLKGAQKCTHLRQKMWKSQTPVTDCRAFDA